MIVTKIASEHKIVDPFTKVLTVKVFEGHLEILSTRYASPCLGQVGDVLLGIVYVLVYFIDLYITLDLRQVRDCSVLCTKSWLNYEQIIYSIK